MTRKLGLVLSLTILLASACSAQPGSPSSSLPPPPIPTPTPVTPTTPTPPHALATPTPRTPAQESSTPLPASSGDLVAYTNPDGPDWSGKPPDTYPFIEKASKLPTYSALWFDENQVDVHIAVTDDIDGAIETLGSYVPRGVTVYFQLAPNTQVDICALRDHIFDDRNTLMDKGIILTGAGCGNAQGRVDIDMSPLMPETLAYMQGRYPGPVDYNSGGIIPLTNYDPPTGEVRIAAITVTEEADLQTCGQRPFPTAALSASPVDVSAAGPEFDALRQAFESYSEIFGDLSQQPWLLAEHDEYGATFLSQRPDGYLEEMVDAGATGWVPTTLAECHPVQFSVASGGSAEWVLDTAYPAPDSTSTELHMLVREDNCASGSSPAGRILPPLVNYEAQSLTVTLTVRSVGAATCQGNPSLAVTIVLPQPVGDRQLVGATDPNQFQ